MSCGRLIKMTFHVQRVGRRNRQPPGWQRLSIDQAYSGQLAARGGTLVGHINQIGRVATAQDTDDRTVGRTPSNEFPHVKFRGFDGFPLALICKRYVCGYEKGSICPRDAGA